MAAALGLSVRVAAGAPVGVPANLGLGLSEIAQWHQDDAGLKALTNAADRSAAVRAHVQEVRPRAQLDATERLVVECILDGRAPVAEVRAQLSALGIEVFAETPANGRSGSAFGRLSARLPIERATEAAAIVGVHSVVLAHRPWRRVGKVTSQGLGLMRQDTVLARGFTGKGIKIGVVSDSFDLITPHADADIASDDLPGPGNPAGRTTPVTVLQEGDASDKTNSDEGRAMLQIVHDMAPDATLVFATSGSTLSTFANSIRSLRIDDNGRCDIVCDDIGFANEPFFSDGIVSQAADDIVNRTDLPGRPVLFYSAGGNDGGLGYEATFNPISDSAVRTGTGRGNLVLTGVPTTLTGGGFHNFAGAAGSGSPGISQSLTVSGDKAQIVLQWDDPFIPGKISADYNLLVFDATGKYLSAISGTDDNVATSEAVEIADLATGAKGLAKTYQFAISKRSTSNPNSSAPQGALGPRSCERGELLELDRPAGLLELGLELLGLVALDALLDGARSRVDQRLGLREAQAGRRADDLDDLDLLVAGGRQDDVDGRRLLFGCAAAVAATGSRGCSCNRGRGNAELFFERLDALGKLKHRNALELFNPLCCGTGHGCCLL